MVCLKNWERDKWCTEGGKWQVTLGKREERTGELWKGWSFGSGVNTGTLKNVGRSSDPELVFNWHLTDRLGEPLKDSPQSLFLTPYFSCEGLQPVYIKSRNRQRSWPNPWPHLSHLPHTHKYTHTNTDSMFRLNLLNKGLIIQQKMALQSTKGKCPLCSVVLPLTEVSHWPITLFGGVYGSCSK